VEIMRGIFSSILVILLCSVYALAQDVLFGSINIADKFGGERVNSYSALRCAQFGFTSDSAKKIFTGLLGKANLELVHDAMAIYDNRHRFLVFGTEDQETVSTDIAFVYVHHKALLDEDGVIYDLQSGLKSLMAKKDSSEVKRKLVLVVDGPEASAEGVKTLLEEAWGTMDKDILQRIINQVSIQMVPVKGAVDSQAVESVDQIINDSAIEVQPLASIIAKAPKSLAKPSVAKTSSRDRGIDTCQEAIAAALRWARDGANANLARLQKLESASDFAGFMENLVDGAIKRMKDNVQSRGGASAEAYRIASEEIRRDIFSMMQPIFRRHVQLARQEVAKWFNKEVGEDMEISANIMNDLLELKNTAIRRYKDDLRKLTPKGAPHSTWDTSFEVLSLKDSLDEYIEGREATCRLQGILPRGRRPIDVSFHVFVPHPFGRDYRADPLLYSDNDEVFFDEGIAKTATPMVNPALARAVLQSPQGQEAMNGKGPGHKLKARDNEFAREMLMFPLSIKNPAVSLMASRGSKRKHGPPKKDPTRATLGPERYVLLLCACVCLYAPLCVSVRVL
jgi:hypothetical protein